MAGVYRPRHPERTVLYQVLFHHFDRFLAEYETRFEKEYGFLRPIVEEVVERYFDCGNPRSGFARIRSPMLSVIIIDISPCANGVPKSTKKH